jgi:hypothetical protein
MVTFLKGTKKTPSELMPRVHHVISLLKRWLICVPKETLASCSFATMVSTPQARSNSARRVLPVEVWYAAHTKIEIEKDPSRPLV